MADNAVLPGTGLVVRADDRSGVITQVVRLDAGTDAMESIVGIGANSLPVMLRNSAGNEVGTDALPLSVVQAHLTAGNDTVVAVGAATHDAPVSGAPVLLGGRAYAAAPSDVSADGHAVDLWLDRAGRVQAIVSQGTAASLKAEVVGPAAHDAAVSGNPLRMAAYASSTAPTAVTAGHTVNLWATLDGALQIGDAGGSLTVDQLTAANLNATVVQSVASNLNVTVGNAVGSGVYVRPGTAASWTVTNAGTFAVQSASAGMAAHDAALSGNPVRIGAVGKDVAPTAVTDGATVNVWADRNGRLHTLLEGVVADDADFTATTTVALPIQGVYEASPTSVTAGDLGVPGITVKRALKVNLVSSADVEIGTDAAPVAVQQAALDPANDTVGVAGIAAADDPVSGNPLLNAARGSAATPTAMSADGDVTTLWSDLYGRLHTLVDNTTGSAVFVQPGSGASFTVAQGTASSLKAEAVGTKTTNAAVPGSTNFGVLPAVANAAAPSITETYLTALSTDLSGNLRTIVQNATGSAVFVQPGSGASFTVAQGTAASLKSEVVGTKSTNAAPGATNLGVLPAIANAAAPTITEGNQAALSTDLAGALRVASHAVTNAGTFAVQATLQAGTAGFGKLTANDGVDIGDVTINNAAGSGAYVQPGTSTSWTVAQSTAASLKAEVVGTKTTNAAVPGATNFGVLAAVANAAAPTITETYLTALSVDLAGGLRVASHPVTNAGTFVVQAEQSTASSLNATVVQGTAASLKAEVVGTKTTNAAVPGATNFGVLPAVVAASAPTLTDTYLAALSLDTGGALRTVVNNATGSAVFVQPGSGASFTVAQATATNLKAEVVGTGTFAVQATGTKTHNAAIPGATNVGVLPAIANAAAPTITETYQSALSMDLAGNLRAILGANSGVDVGDVTINNAAGAGVYVQPGTATSWTVTNAGTFAVQAAQSVAANLNATVVGTGTFVVQAEQSTASSLNATVVQGTASNLKAEVVGTKTTNAAIPGATNFGVLPAVANAAAPTITETYLTALSVDLAGGLRVASHPVTNAGTFAVQSQHAKTIKSYSATISADTDVIAAVTSKRIKVCAYSITTVSTTACTVIFKSNGTAGTELWRVHLQAAANVVAGANLAVSAPAFLFGTVAGEKLTADVSADVALHVSLSYYDDDAA